MYPDKILTTTNGGALWTPHVITGISLNSVSFVNDQTGWVLDYTYSSIYKTVDGGTNWILQYTNPFTAPAYDIHFIDENYGWVQRHDQILFTTDGGATWDSVPSPSTTSVSQIQFLNATTGYCLNSDYIFKSTDGGQSWIQKTVWTGSEILNSFHALDEDHLWVVGENGLIRYSENGGNTWTTLNSGISATLNDVCFSDLNNGIIVGLGGTILSTSNGGLSWVTNSSGVLTDLYQLDMVNAGQAWVTGSAGVILNSYANTDLQTEMYVGEDSACAGDLVSVLLVVKNNGTSPITDATFSLSDLSGNLFDYNWTGNLQPGLTETIDVGYISSTLSQNYTVTITGDAVVTNNTFSFLVEQLVAPDGVVSGPHNICAGDSVKILVSGGISYEWINTGSNDAAIYVTPTVASSQYIVKVFDEFNCVNYDTVLVFLNSAANVIASGPHEYCPGDSIQISVSGGVTYEWLNIASSNSTLYVTPHADTNEYYAVIYDASNCKTFDTVFVYLSNDCNPTVPANVAFSPNGDLKNDYLYLDGLDSNSNTVIIYSRWGDELASFQNYDNVTVRWDGTSNGQICPQGTYYYILEIAATNSKLIGWIQIVY